MSNMVNCYSSSLCGCQAPNLGPSLARTCSSAPAILTFMALIDVYLRKRCDITDPCRRVRPKLKPDSWYDFIVVGGGSGGSVVAGRLAEIPYWKILLIEAGGEEPVGAAVPLFTPNFWNDELTDWNYKTEPQENACLSEPGRRCKWPRGKVLGGTGAINGMMYMRGSKKDYDSWEKMGNVGWSWEKVLPYFKKLENKKSVGGSTNYSYHGVGGPITIDRFPYQPPICFDILKAAKEQGLPVSDDLNDRQRLGFTIAQANQRDGVRLSSASAYLRPQRENLHVMLNSTVTKILIDSNTKRAYGVEFLYKNKTYNVNITKEIIISGGTINSPKLLLLSGIGPKEDLKKVGIPVIHDLQGVGKHLHNHVGTSLMFSLTKLPAKNHLTWRTVMQYLFDRKGPLTSTAMSQFTGILNSKYADPAGDDPDLQFYFSGFHNRCGTGLDEPNSAKSEILTIYPINLQPNSYGYIKLRSRNPLERPIMQPNYLTDKQDIKVIIDGIRISLRLANATILKEKYGIKLMKDIKEVQPCKRFAFNTDQFWECYIKYKTAPENHQVGTCKMGPKSDRFAVVDPKLSVHGVRGLRVADASIMPKVISGNTQAATFMIGEKAGDFIKEYWLGAWIAPKANFPDLENHELEYDLRKH